jgi:hypothetical protein
MRIRKSRIPAGLAGLMAAMLALGTGLPHGHAAPAADTHHQDCDHAPEAPDSAPATGDTECSHCAFLSALVSAAVPDAPILVPAQAVCGTTLCPSRLLGGRLVHLSVSARAPPPSAV